MNYDSKSLEFVDVESGLLNLSDKVNAEKQGHIVMSWNDAHIVTASKTKHYYDRFQSNCRQYNFKYHLNVFQMYCLLSL